MFNPIKVGIENIDNTNILNEDSKEEQQIYKQENNKCFLFCFQNNNKEDKEYIEEINKNKKNKIYPFLEFDDNCVNIKIYQYNQTKFLRYYNNCKYNKIIDIDVKNINNFDFDTQDLINNFIKTCISKILDKNNESKIISISNNLSLQVFQKIHDVYKIVKQLNPISEN
jgi:hypothetical protein